MENKPSGAVLRTNQPGKCLGWNGCAIGAVALLVCATVLAYLPALKSGFVWDDNNTLTENPLIKAADGLYRFWFTTQPVDYWPVTSSTLWLEWRLWGMNALGYHATNLALHIAESLLLWAILRRLRVPGALLAAFIFALHPVNVESVAWITQRKNLVAMLFFLLSIFWFLKTDLAAPTDSGRRLYRLGAGRWYGLSLLSFTLGMLSKGSVATVPIVLLGLIAWHRRIVFRDLLRTAPFFLVAIIFAGVDVWFQSHGQATSVRSAGGIERLLGAGGVIWFYLYKALLPLNLIFVYPEWHTRSNDPLWWAPLLAAIATTAVLWRYRHGWSRPALFFWGYFCVTLVPVLGFTDVYFMRYSLVADHYQHIAIIAPIVLVSAGLALALRRLQPGARVAIRVAGVLLLSALGVLTWRQCRMYDNIETLFLTTLGRNPGCWMAHDNLGVALAKYDGRLPDAIVHFEAALKINPEDPVTQNNLGNALVKIPGRLPEAIAHYETAVRLQPNYVHARVNLGIILSHAGRLTEAVDQFEAALRFDPGNLEAHKYLGIAFGRENRIEEAVDQFEEALRIDPDDAGVRHNLGHALQLEGRTEQAQFQFDAATRLRADQSRGSR